jgi:Txe/YoeB family toxin of Txe-Axe toxin-antitoxin module
MAHDEQKAPPSTPPPESDRRGGQRLLACFPGYIERPGSETHMALIRDLSTSGAQLLVRMKLDVGDTLKIQLFLSENLEEPRVTTGRVTRVEPLSDDEVGMWSRRIGVQFDEPLTMYAAEIDAIKERERRLRISTEG